MDSKTIDSFDGNDYFYDNQNDREASRELNSIRNRLQRVFDELKSIKYDASDIVSSTNHDLNSATEFVGEFVDAIFSESNIMDFMRSLNKYMNGSISYREFLNCMEKWAESLY